MKNVTLEMSLKPFKKVDDEYIMSVCRSIFEQWKPLLKNAEIISVMLWTADGSEILDYKGNENDEFEWCYFVGGANPKSCSSNYKDPEGVGLHARNYYYMNNHPKMTYKILKTIVSSIKMAGKEFFPDKKIRVGETFDIGPEFAISDFKYNKHPEICTGFAMGSKVMVCAYEKLHADKEKYAGFPDGIKEGTPFGTFFGRQSQVFLSDMGFDYIWFSNGLGFGRETWSSLGAIFDGEKFHEDKLDKISKDVIEFWHLFRKECPDFPIETRGTNMSTGIDMASDGVPLKKIYDGGFNMLPPVNSPWAALDDDFGLEIMGHLSRIAYVPNNEYTFRYYIHDPWWLNSPWYDRYGSNPHDIYLPMSVARIDENGNTHPADNLNLLSIDNSWGDMPDSCANEPIPHLLKAFKDAPDAPSPLVWVYPFREYCDAKDSKTLNEMYHGDWYIRSCINNGVPISSVITTDNFINVDKSIFSSSILITPVPYKESKFEEEILSYIKRGGKVIFYGNADRAGEKFLKTAGIKLTDEISGELNVTVNGIEKGKVKHDSFLNAGGINTISDGAEVFAEAEGKAIAVKNGSCIYIRATLSNDYIKGRRLLIPHDENKYFLSETIMLTALEKFGMVIRYDREKDQRNPVTMISRSDNAFMYSIYTPSVTAKTTMHSPLGAPILIGYETKLENGMATYHFPKSEHKECRVFVEQNDGIVSVRERMPGSYQNRRMIAVYGLKNATVRFFAQSYCKDTVTATLNKNGGEELRFTTDDFDGGIEKDSFGTYFEMRNVTGTALFRMPDVKHNGVIKQDY